MVDDTQISISGSTEPSQEPVKNPALIAPLPPVGPQVSPDSIRQYYLKNIPQYRTFPLQGNLLGGVGSVPAGQVAATTVSSSSSGDIDPYMFWKPVITTVAGGQSVPISRAYAENGNVSLTQGPITINVTPGTAPLAGDVLFVVLQYFNSSSFTGHGNTEAATRTVTDNVGNVWTEVAHVFNPVGNGSADIGEGMSLWVCLSAIASTPTITATVNTPGVPDNDAFTLAVWYSDISGVTALSVDTTGVGFAGAGSFTTTPTLTFNTTANDFVFTVFGLFSHASGITATAGTGYTVDIPLNTPTTLNAEFSSIFAANVLPGVQSPSLNASSSVDHWMYIGVGLNISITFVQTSPGYQVNDVFRYQGIEYICIADNPTGILPDTPGWVQYWQIVCAGTQDNNVNLQAGTSYTILDSDFSKLLYFSNSSPIAVSLPQANTNYQFNAGWWCYVENVGAGLLTITPVSCLIDSAANTTLSQDQGIIIFTDGVNYYTFRCLGTVTHTTGGLTNHAVIIGNGDGDIRALGSLGTTTTVLHGNASGDPSFSSVVENDISLSDVTTDDVSITKHGFAPKAPNDATKFLDGTGNYSTPGGSAPTGSGNKIYATPADGSSGAATLRVAVVNDYKFHDEVLTDGASNIIYAAGDVVMTVGVPNP